jgi:glycosyltransferase involved in cell wall biosynthesis
VTDERTWTLLAAGTYDADAHPRIRVLLEGMRARGWRVDEVVEPLGVDTRQRVRALRHAAGLPALALGIGRAWWRLVPRLRRRMRTGPRPDAVVVGHLGHFDVGLVRLLTRPAPVVLDFLVSGAGTAADRGVGGAPKRWLLAALDRFALGRADVVVVDTNERVAELPPRVRPRAVVVPVGADERWFAVGRTTSPTGIDGPLCVIFFGLFTPLQGTTTIAAALRELDGAVAATVVGGGQDEDAADTLLRGVPGVRRLPWVPGDDLPALVARHDVCLGIVGTTAKAHSVVPTKVFQGAAAGCAIVTGDTPPQRRALGDAAVFVPPGDAPALAAALRDLAADDERLAQLRRAARARAEAAFAAVDVVAALDARLRRNAREAGGDGPMMGAGRP